MRIQVLNKSGDLRPGMFARGSIIVDKHDNVVILPKDALVAEGRGHAVWMISDSKAQKKPVTTGYETREEIEAVSGVSASDVLVIVGQDKLSDGVKVQIVDENGQSAGVKRNVVN